MLKAFDLSSTFQSCSPPQVFGHQFAILRGMQQIDQAEEIIYLQEGWERIDKVGIQPFLHRVEIFDTDELDKKPNPMQEFLSTYDTVT